MTNERLRVVRAQARLQAAALTWHYLVDAPDRGRSRQAVEDLHSAAAELGAALEDAERQGQHGGPNEDDPENQDQAGARA